MKTGYATRAVEPGHAAFVMEPGHVSYVTAGGYVPDVVELRHVTSVLARGWKAEPQPHQRHRRLHIHMDR